MVPSLALRPHRDAKQQYCLNVGQHPLALRPSRYRPSLRSARFTCMDLHLELRCDGTHGKFDRLCRTRVGQEATEGLG